MAAMMRGSLASVIPHAALDTTSKVYEDPRVNVQVSIEALCIDSKHFILNNLLQTYHLLGPSITNLNLTPFGNASILNTQSQTIKCQHGAAECDANSYEQCLIDTYPDPLDYLPMMQCLFTNLPMGYRDTLFDVEMFSSCASDAGLDFERIQSCHDDTEKSWSLQLKNEKETPSEHNHVPWVDLNGVYMDEERARLEVEVCKVFVDGGGKNDVCDDVLLEEEELKRMKQEEIWFDLEGGIDIF